ncbi:MAG: hypothetical protein GXP09_05660 [Gammaproteobacteria bacterium]|nr:hypothetical protein [Gammaproteobacteria bacterium]
MMSLGVKLGDESITTSFSIISTAEVTVRIGVTPAFVDIGPDTRNIDTSLIEAKRADNIKAIMSVSLYGQPA